MTDATHDLPPALRTFVDATNDADPERFVTAFTDDAFLDDWGRTFHGREGVASWDRTDNIGKRSRFAVRGVRPGSTPDEVLLDVTVAGDGYNGPATFTILLRDELIARLVIS